MAAPAIPHGECHLHVTGATETPGVVCLRGKLLSSLVFDIEEVRMATGTVEIGGMLLMGKFDIAPMRGRPEIKGLTQFLREGHDSVLAAKRVFRRYFSVSQRFTPVDTVTEPSLGEGGGKFGKRLFENLRLFHVALWALELGTAFERKRGLAVVAGTTVLLGVKAIG